MAAVDIIVPAYNAERYLAAALDSVIVQTVSDWRILLIDDGSTDETPAIAARYASMLGPRMLLVHQQNGGLPVARNTALRHASAEFLALLDADDVWLPHRLQYSLERMRARPEAGLSYGLITRIDAKGLLLDTWAGNPSAYAEGELALAIYLRKVELPCPTMMFRRSALETLGAGFDETMRATEDRDLWLRLALRFPVVFVPHVIAYYRTSLVSMSADPDRMLRSQKQFIDKHARIFHRRARRTAMARAWKQHAEALAAGGRPWAALRSATHALALSPLEPDNLRTGVSLLLRSLGLRRP